MRFFMDLKSEYGLIFIIFKYFNRNVDELFVQKYVMQMWYVRLTVAYGGI